MGHGHAGSAEVAAMLGVTRQRVRQLRETYPDFPPPVADLARGPIWHTEQIAAWQRKHPERPSGRHAEATTGPSKGQATG